MKYIVCQHAYALQLALYGFNYILHINIILFHHLLCARLLMSKLILMVLSPKNLLQLVELASFLARSRSSDAKV